MSIKPIDLEKLTRLASEFDRGVDEAMDDNADFVEYVRRLEEEGDDTPIDPTRSGQMIREIEDFLKDRH